MFVLRVPNVNKALPMGLRWLMGYNGTTEDSRNGPVIVSNMPVTTIYDDITHRVLFSPVRDANPYFHLFESLWMLAGRNDLPILAQFNKQMASYSDDGGATQPAAYGHRWRKFFGTDQLDAIVQELIANPSTRRCVLAMWNPGGDRDNSVMVGVNDLFAAMNGSKDVPCNTHCYFRIQDRQLHMMVSCRSNDVLWGAYGANAVHFSVLLEYLAARVGVAPGKMTQVSWNYHVYTKVLGDQAHTKALIEDCENTDFYSSRVIRPARLVHDPIAFERDLPYMLEAMEPGNDAVPSMSEPFLTLTALPMLRSWQAHKRGDYVEAEEHARRVRADDWRLGATAWMERRAIKRRLKEQGL